MPHLVIEYSAGTGKRADMAALCNAAHAALKDSGMFPLAGIRVRAHKADIAVVADAHEDNDFLAMTLSIGAGRSTEQLKQVGEALFNAVCAQLAEPLSTPHFALSLEIRIIDPELNWKQTPIHDRLSAK